MWGLRTFTPLGRVAIASIGPALGSSLHYPLPALQPPVLRCPPLRYASRFVRNVLATAGQPTRRMVAFEVPGGFLSVLPWCPSMRATPRIAPRGAGKRKGLAAKPQSP